MSKEIISYDDFAKLDIALGTIIAIEQVEGADKLLKLTVDIGEMDIDGVTMRPRQIISGIKEYFEDIQVLIGRQCPFLVNLQPRVIRGLESQGMILAADFETTFALLEPSAKLPEGTRVH